MSKSNLRCPTPACVDAIARYGEHYHGVTDKGDAQPPDGIVASCERCGGTTTDGINWIHQCAKCGTVVEPGALLGFFVPHRCKTCDEKIVAEQRAAGQLCRRCNTVIAYCCC